MALLPRLAELDFADLRRANTEAFSQFLAGGYPTQATNLINIAGRQLGIPVVLTGKVSQTGINGVARIARWRRDFKVLRAIIGWIAVQVIDAVVRAYRANEGFGNKAMNEALPLDAILRQRLPTVATINDLFRPKYSNSAASVARKSPHSPKRRNVVNAFVADNWFPNLHSAEYSANTWRCPCH